MPNAATYPDCRCQTPAVITVNTSNTTSAEVDLGGTELVGMQFPPAMTSTALTVQASPVSGGTYGTMVNAAGANIAVNVANGAFVGIDPTLLRGARFLKLVTGAAEAANRTITLFSVPMR